MNAETLKRATEIKEKLDYCLYTRRVLNNENVDDIIDSQCICLSYRRYTFPCLINLENIFTKDELRKMLNIRITELQNELANL